VGDRNSLRAVRPNDVLIEHSNILYSAPTAKNNYFNLFTKKTAIYYEIRVNKIINYARKMKSLCVTTQM